jgi:hypothetical protein
MTSASCRSAYDRGSRDQTDGGGGAEDRRVLKLIQPACRIAVDSYVSFESWQIVW